MRKLIEKVKTTPTAIVLSISSDDGLEYAEEVMFGDVYNHKDFAKRLETARQSLVSKRIWLNARKALTAEEIRKL